MRYHVTSKARTAPYVIRVTPGSAHSPNEACGVKYVSSMLMCALRAGMALAASPTSCPRTLDFRVEPLAGDTPVHLCDAYRGKVVLIVHTANQCAFAPQYEGLEAPYRKYRGRGLVILGFSSSDFGNQAPGSAAQIATFCRMTYGVQFPMFAKTRVRQGQADPRYRSLGSPAGEYPASNFHKYLRKRRGDRIGGCASQVTPDDPRLARATGAPL